MPVKFPRPTSNKSGTKIASILHQIHGSLTTRRDPTAKDNWGLSGVLGSLTPRGHFPYPHSLHEGRMNYTPCYLNTYFLDHHLHQCVRTSIWNTYKWTYVTWPYVLVTTDKVIDGWRDLSFHTRAARSSLLSPGIGKTLLKEHDNNLPNCDIVDLLPQESSLSSL